jgi:flagellin
MNVTEGALNEQSGILIRLRELASQAATGTVGSTERQTIQLEFTALRSELDRISATTEFNGQKLIDGNLASGIAINSHTLIQIGLDSSANSRIDLNTQINLASIDSTQLAIHNLSVTASSEALTALDKINEAIGSITESRGKVGAVHNRLTRSIANLSVSVENLTAAESSIRDADIAEEVAELTRNQILVQTATAMVGQANLIPQSVLQLLG